jgi:hypothetical protein
VYTKGDLVRGAYAELAIAGWVWDLDPEELLWACGRMDMMMARWADDGIELGYNISLSPPTDLNVASGIPLNAVLAVILNLAVAIAAGKGKQLSPATIGEANNAYKSLCVAAAMPGQQQLPDSLPLGAGNTPWRFGYPQNPYFPGATEGPWVVGPNGNLIVRG